MHYLAGSYYYSHLQVAKILVSSHLTTSNAQPPIMGLSCQPSHNPLCVLCLCNNTICANYTRYAPASADQPTCGISRATANGNIPLDSSQVGGEDLLRPGKWESFSRQHLSSTRYSHQFKSQWPWLREVTSLTTLAYCSLAYVAISTSDPITRDHLAYAQLIILESRPQDSARLVYIKQYLWI